MMVLLMKKARGRGHLVPVKKQVLRDGKSFMQTVWVSPDETQGQSAKAQTQFAEVTARYQGTPQWLKAPNGRPSKLTERQWVRVRTESFKKKHGDWERKALKKFLNGAPVSEIEAGIAPHQGFAALRTWATNLFQKQGGKAINIAIGEVLLDDRAVRDSIAHSMNSLKADAFASVKDVIEKGRIVLRGKSDEGIDSVYIAAPVKIGESETIVIALVHAAQNNRMYLHGVITKEALQEQAVKSTTDDKSGARSSPTLAGIRSILKGALSVNPSDVAIALDENGEPQVTRIDGKDYFVNTRTSQQKSAGGIGPAGKSDSSLNKSVALLYCKKTGRYLFKRIRRAL